ncbi:MAG TPA: polysaccharide biosynthesis/export family protein [Pyrinomonadaceae bacterium]|nr:polysaccharide biosynthesis/export family protein [Pyrinomonadaceae bacterium]
MKNLLLAGAFALLALAPIHAQTDDAENSTAKNQHPTGIIAESASAVTKAAPDAEAQKSYDEGVVLYNSGKLPEAVDAFKQSNKLKPNDPQTNYMLGMAYWKSKSYIQSVDAFKRAIKVKPEWDEAYFRLGLSYYVLGRTGNSNETYKKLLALNPSLAAKLARIIGEPKSDSNTAKAKPEPAETKPVAIIPVSNSPTTENETRPVTANNVETTEPKPVESPAVKPNGPEANAGNNPVARETSPSLPAAKPVDDSLATEIYRVGVGDVLDIRFLNTSSTHSTLYSVIDGGLIDLPIAGGAIAVAGLTPSEIQARVTSQLKRLAVSEQTQVSVGVRQYGSHSVVVTGLAQSPGAKILRREAVPLYVLLAEIQPRLDAARAVVMRTGGAPQILDLNDSSSLNFLVRSGDVINLTARQPDFYYIAGKSINFPGQKAFQSGITLVQAILAAGGLARDGAVELSREGADGRLATTKLNLKEIKSGKVQDPKIQPGDRIEVLK